MYNIIMSLYRLVVWVDDNFLIVMSESTHWNSFAKFIEMLPWQQINLASLKTLQVALELWFMVARNEVKNASFAQRSAHSEGMNKATGIDWTCRRAQATRADDDGRSNRPTPTHRIWHSAIFPL